MLTNNSKLITNNHNLKPKNDLKYRSFNFSLEIIRLTKDFPNQRTYWIISDQLLRAATSIGANIIEPKASASKRDFIHFYQIALKSANETYYWLSLLKEGSLNLNEEKTNYLLRENDEIIRMLASSLLTMKGKKFKS